MKTEDKSIALVASSGGGTAMLGGTNAVELMSQVNEELGKLKSSTSLSSCKLKYAIYVGLPGGASMDNIRSIEDAKSHVATLYTVDFSSSSESKDEFSVDQVTASLDEINNMIKSKYDKEMANLIASKKITSLISISSDPLNVNKLTFEAAAKAKIPVTGSGGTSLSTAASNFIGLNIVGNSGGSVATTTYTKAVSFCYALSSGLSTKDEKVVYEPLSLSKGTKAPQMKSILEACLPAFITVSILLSFLGRISLPSDAFGSSQLEDWKLNLEVQLETKVLPTVCCIISANSYAPEHGSTAIMASGVASLCVHHSVLGGLITGYLTAILVRHTLLFCVRINVPATMTNIICAGGVGGIVVLCAKI